MTLARTLFDNYLDVLFEGAPSSWKPLVGATETSKAYTIQMDIPGVSREDVKLQCDRGVLTLAGERRSPRLADGESALRTETPYGKFVRHFTLPESVAVEGIEATMNDGVLTVRIPKAARGSAAREIKIS